MGIDDLRGVTNLIVEMGGRKRKQKDQITTSTDRMCLLHLSNDSSEVVPFTE